jgi:Mg-chelatase subunit ChlI
MDDQFLEEIDAINNMIEILVDQMHDALESGDYVDAEAIGIKIRHYTEILK